MMRRGEKMAPRNNGTLLVTALLLIAAISRGQAETVYRSSGSNITLSPNNRGDFKEITWLLNNNKLVDLELNEKKEPVYYTSFPQLKAGASLNNQTGDLTIPQLTIRDSGDYRAEVKLHDLTYIYTDITLTVLDPVVTPNITNQTTEDWIFLSCESATPGVTYKWKNDKGIIVSNEQTHTILKPEKLLTLTCFASNEVSEGRASVTIEPRDPVVTPIITSQTNEYWIQLSCESATPGVSYEWQDDEGNIVSDDKTYTIPKHTEAAVTLICIASNEVSEGRASVTIVPGGLSGGAIAGIIAGIIVGILVLIFVIIWIFECIRRKCHNYPRVKAINKRCPPFPYIPNWITALHVGQPASFLNFRDLLTHISNCPNKPCCFSEFAEKKEGNLEKAEDLQRHIANCTRTRCCIKENAGINRARPNMAEDNLKPDNEGNGTPEQQEILLENMGKENKTGSREEV